MTEDQIDRIGYQSEGPDDLKSCVELIGKIAAASTNGEALSAVMDFRKAQRMAAARAAQANVQPKGMPATLTKTDLARLWRSTNGSSRWPSDVDAFVNAWLAQAPAVGAGDARDAALDEAAALCEMWNTSPGRALAKEIRKLKAPAAPSKCDCTAYCGQYLLHGSCRAHPAVVTVSDVPVQGSSQ